MIFERPLYVIAYRHACASGVIPEPTSVSDAVADELHLDVVLPAVILQTSTLIHHRTCATSCFSLSHRGHISRRRYSCCCCCKDGFCRLTLLPALIVSRTQGTCSKIDLHRLAARERLWGGGERSSVARVFMKFIAQSLSIDYRAGAVRTE